MSSVPTRIEILAEAMDEARVARLWYSERDPTLGPKFMASLDEAIDDIAQSPFRRPAHLHGTRRYIMRRFPYVVVYRVAFDRIQIVACHHARRRPDYWVNRLQ